MLKLHIDFAQSVYLHDAGDLSGSVIFYAHISTLSDLFPRFGCYSSDIWCECLAVMHVLSNAHVA